jgi:cyanophycinase
VTVFLVGGGPDTAGPGLVAPFLAEVRAAATGRARVAVLLCGPAHRTWRQLPAARRVLADAAVDLRPVHLRAGRPVPAAALAGVDGVVVGGGVPGAYLASLAPAAAELSAAVAAGTPYLGFSAGAMVAARTALLGGHRSGGREVCPVGWSEGLTPVTVAPGLGLVGFPVDAHTAAAGTLGRTVALVTDGTAPVAAGIDEGTCLALPAGAQDPADGVVTGSGGVWTVRRGGDGAVVTVRSGRDAG